MEQGPGLEYPNKYENNYEREKGVSEKEIERDSACYAWNRLEANSSPGSFPFTPSSLISPSHSHSRCLRALNRPIQPTSKWFLFTVVLLLAKSLFFSFFSNSLRIFFFLV